MDISFSFTNRSMWRGVLIVLLIGSLALNLWGTAPRPAYAATIDVDRTDDDPAAAACTAAPNDCSLRGAITAAEASPGPDTINLPAGTYTLVGGGLLLTSDISLIGAGAATTIIQANANPEVADYGVIVIFHPVNITISGVTIRHGQELIGGGIFNEIGQVTITGGTVISDNSGILGGGIHNQAGQITITGGAAVSGNFSYAGGGIYNEAGQVTIMGGAAVSGNEGFLGGGILNLGGQLTITGAGTVIGGVSASARNVVRDTGGVTNIGQMSIEDGAALIGSLSIGARNLGLGFGGGIVNGGQMSITDGAAVTGNEAVIAGGIFNTNETGTVRVENATVSDNLAYFQGGGGLVTAGAIAIRDSIFSGNTAPEGLGGGGILVEGATVTITGSTFTNNRANKGGAIAIYSDITFPSNLSISNSTVSGNSATGSGGGIYVRDETSLRLTNVTIANNTAGSGGGLFFENGPDVSNTIIAGNHASNGADCTSFGAALNSLDHNVIGDTTGCPIGGTTTHNMTGVNPLLGPLQDNGGPTVTHLPLAGSPAIDTGDDALCAAAPINNLDQRGMTRPVDGNGDGTPQCDIGAVELESVPTQIILSAEDNARSQAPLCALIGGGTNSIVRADVLGGTITNGSVFCRVIAQDGVYVTGPQELGNADLIALGVIQAVDVFGLKHDGTAETLFNATVNVCLQGAGRLFYLDATTSPRALSQLPATSEFGYTCALIYNAGMVVLVP